MSAHCNLRSLLGALYKEVAGIIGNHRGVIFSCEYSIPIGIEFVSFQRCKTLPSLAFAGLVGVTPHPSLLVYANL